MNKVQAMTYLVKNGFSRFGEDMVQTYNCCLKRMPAQVSSWLYAANHLAWDSFQTPMYQMIEGYFCVVLLSGAEDEPLIWLPPVGSYGADGRLGTVLDRLGDIGLGMEEKMRFYAVSEWMLPFYEKLHFKKEISFMEGDSDYIYRMEDIEKKISHKKQRYYAKRFRRDWEPTIEPFRCEDMEECIRLIRQVWCSSHRCEECKFGCAKEAFRRMADLRGQIPMEILLIWSSRGAEDGAMPRDGSGKRKAIAYVIFLEEERELVYFARKVGKKQQGFTEYMGEFLWEHWKDRYERMNYEEDMGLEGLRTHKRIFAPYSLRKSYSILISGKEKQAE